jgi:3-methyladenine DNA glycosylase Tag
LCFDCCFTDEGDAKLRSFDEIYQIAATRKGGDNALEALLAQPGLGGLGAMKSHAELAATPDAHWLEAMAKSVFQAGFNWKVVEAKWDGFRESFYDFDPPRVAFFHDEDMDRLLSNKAVIRNGAKLQSVVENARLVCDFANEGGSAGAVLGQWPDHDFVGLLRMLTKRGTRLGGNTGQRVLRMMGRDGFMLSGDVVARLVAEGVIDKAPTSQRAMAAVQGAFNDWQSQSGRCLCDISRTLAMSV